VNVKYTVKTTNKFRKDYKLMEKRNLNMSLLDEIITKLAQGIVLPASNRDHVLIGNYVGHRGCHIQPDWILIYRIDGDVLVLLLTRTGSHSDLFYTKLHSKRIHRYFRRSEATEVPASFKRALGISRLE
jgi:mRNA interferase YafQ